MKVWTEFKTREAAIDAGYNFSGCSINNYSVIVMPSFRRVYPQKMYLFAFVRELSQITLWAKRIE